MGEVIIKINKDGWTVEAKTIEGTVTQQGQIRGYGSVSRIEMNNVRWIDEDLFDVFNSQTFYQNISRALSNTGDI